jgi:hypothetical protein
MTIDAWATAMKALEGDPEANRKAALAITGALSAPAKGIWDLFKADAEYAKANRDAAKRTSGRDTIGGNPGGIDMISGMGLPLMAKALRGADKATEAVPGIRAYHGSPHDFDKFDLSKIGTGEGAQAYGHGLYFAGNEGVAKSYRDTLAKGFETKSGAPISKDMQAALEYISPKFKASGDFEGGVRDAIARMRDQADFYRKQYGPGLNLYDSAVERLMKVAPADLKPAGRMYEVNIAAKPEQFLDWDKPLRAQPGVIESALRSPQVKPDLEYVISRGGTKAEPGEWRGRELWEMVADRANAGKARSEIAKYGGPTASTALRDAGIPGIKYLDQGSRNTAGGELIDVFKKGDDWFAKIRVQDRSTYWANAPGTAITTSMPLKSEEAARKWAQDKIGGGTSNYVLFRDDIIDILRKYGIPGAGVAGAGALAGGAPDAMADAIRGKKP